MSKASNRTKQQIKQAAIALFSVKGFGGTSVREVSEEAGVNSALVSYHFKNKQGILESIMIDYFEQLFDRLNTCCEDSAEHSNCFDQLMIAVQNVVQYQCNNIRVSTIIQRELSVDSMLIREVMSTYITRLKAFFSTIIEMGMEMGEFRSDIEIDMQTIHLMSSIFFPYFNPQIIREVFYVDPISDEYRTSYVSYLKKIWYSQLKRAET